MAAAVGGRWFPLLGSDREVGEVFGVSIDSRSIAGGEVFVAVRAARDGHDYVEAAFDQGAVAAIVDHAVGQDVAPAADPRRPQLIVHDTRQALTAWGTAARDRLHHPVIGVTGSVGKTTTKDLLRGIGSIGGTVNAPARSLNNELGVPMTLISSDPAATWTVLEMGARHRGDVAHLCVVGRPSIGVITAVGAAHLSEFGSIEDVAVAKGELVECLPATGTAVLRADQPLVMALAARTAAAVLTFGDGGDVVASDVVVDEALRASFVLQSPWGNAEVVLGIAGEHQVSNALAAAAAALSAGADLADVAEGLGQADLSPGRMAVHVTPAGATVIDDSYNANPVSMAAAIAALLSRPARRRVAVLGIMAELGDASPGEHRAVTEQLQAAGVEIIPVGTDLYGPAPVADAVAAVEHLGALVEGDVVLIKGSRVARLEAVVAALLGPTES